MPSPRLPPPFLLLMAVALVVQLTAGGCQCNHPPQGGADSGMDAGPEDAGADAGPADAGMDAGSQTDAGSSADAGADAGPFAYVTDSDLPPIDDRYAPAVLVQVMDVNGLPIEGAQAAVGAVQATTDALGNATLSKVTPSPQTVIVQAAGYSPGAVEVEPAPYVKARASVTLLRPEAVAQFFPQGGINYRGANVWVDIPPSSVVDAQGNPVDGAVTLSIAQVDPTQPRQLRAAPRPFAGLPQGGTQPVPFQSLFMADVSLSQGRSVLKLKPGAIATLTYVLPDTLQGVYPDALLIEAWWYDVSAGLWRQEGNGQIQTVSVRQPDGTSVAKQVWIAQVGHFTWWNCDAPWTDKNCVRVTVVDSGGAPIPGAVVRVDGATYVGTSGGTSDAQGKTCVNFKLNSTVTLSAGRDGFSMPPPGEIKLTGSPTPATCQGEGSGHCIDITLRMLTNTCVSGDVIDASGKPASNTNLVVVQTLAGSGGERSTAGRTDAAGHYCVEGVTTSSKVKVVVYNQSVTADSAVGNNTTGADAGTCSCGNCLHMPQLALGASPGTCLHGRGFVGSWNGIYGISTNTPAGGGVPVYIYDRSSFRFPSCKAGESDPATWGKLLGQTVTNSDGTFCAEGIPGLPVGTGGHEVSVVLGNCSTWNSDRCAGISSANLFDSSGTCGCTDPSTGCTPCPNETSVSYYEGCPAP